MASEPKKKHTSKEIRAAIDYAKSKGWRVEDCKGHAWGKILCPNNDKDCRCGEFCSMSIWSTPKRPESFANGIKQKVDGCIYPKSDDDELGDDADFKE